MKNTRISDAIALIGVGLMGTGIGYNILQKGYDLYLLDNHSRTGVEFLKKHGAKVFDNLKELSSATKTFILCLPSSVEVEDVCMEHNGLLKYVQPSSLILDCTTALPSSTQLLHEMFAKKEAIFIDAPLTRTPTEAMQGKLNCLLGGGEVETAFAKPILSLFCENIFETGSVGSGNLYKIINNGFTLGITAIVSEILKVSIENKLDLSILRKIVSKGGANNPQFQGFMSWLLDGDEDALKFSLKNATKDIGYLQKLTKDDGFNDLIDSIYSLYIKANRELGEEATLPQLCNQKAGQYK